MYNGRMSEKSSLAKICEQFGVRMMYSFGSRSRQVLAWLQGKGVVLPADGSDVDIGVVTAVPLTIRQKAELAITLENLFGVNRVDLAAVPEVDPFLAANIIRGERLYAVDDYLADEYELYILRRAGDLIPLERERQQLILENFC